VKDLTEYRRPSGPAQRKIRVNPLYILLTLVALLPFYVLYLRHAAEEKKREYRRVELDRFSLKLPGEVQLSKVLRDGVHYVGSAGPKLEAIAAIVPAPAGSEIRSAFGQGSLPMARVFTKLLPHISFERIECRNAGENRYAINARRAEDGWAMAAHLLLLPKQNTAILLMAITPKKEDAGQVRQRMVKSFTLSDSLSPADAAPDTPEATGKPGTP
jgi:hypothetical protein